MKAFGSGWFDDPIHNDHGDPDATWAHDHIEKPIVAGVRADARCYPCMLAVESMRHNNIERLGVVMTLRGQDFQTKKTVGQAYERACEFAWIYGWGCSTVEDAHQQIAAARLVHATVN